MTTLHQALPHRVDIGTQFVDAVLGAEGVGDKPKIVIIRCHDGSVHATNHGHATPTRWSRWLSLDGDLATTPSSISKSEGDCYKAGPA